ncbi:MAG: hypothetical protein WKG00_23475 [Polyangiaceae bacterium]
MTRSSAGASFARRVAAAGVALALLVAQGSAGAQTKQELDKARTLFREAVALSAANDWSGALSKFKEVAQVRMTAQVAFNIAECEEHLGKLLAALGNYRLASSEAAAPNANAPEVAKQVDARISALEARIPKMTIARGEGAETATIELDGVELGSAQIGSPIPVDPGPHTVLGKVNGREGARETVTLAESETKDVSVTIASAPLPKEQPVAPTQPDVLPPPEIPGSKVPGIVVTGLGVASLGAGVVFLILRQGTLDDLDELCGGDESCPPSAKSKADDGKLFTGLAEATIAAGVVGVAVGVVLLATSGKKTATATATGVLAPGRQAKPSLRFVGAAPGATAGGASLVGSF